MLIIGSLITQTNQLYKILVKDNNKSDFLKFQSLKWNNSSFFFLIFKANLNMFFEIYHTDSLHNF